MKELENEIDRQIEILKCKIESKNDKEEIEKERKKLDYLLREYLKDL